MMDEIDDIDDDVPAFNETAANAQNKKKIERMRKRLDRKTGIIYPEDAKKGTWDLSMALVLIFTCAVTPYRIAFSEDTLTWYIINKIVDFLFLVDIFVIFNTAFYDEDFVLHEGRSFIAKAYIKSWFVMDLLAIMPFDEILGGWGPKLNTNKVKGQKNDAKRANEVVRIARLGRMYKLIKLTRLIRVIKVIKDKSKFLKFAQEYLKLS